MATILIVDDEPSVRVLMRASLERAGHEVREAADGAAALRTCEEQPPDMVVTDLRMPVMDGRELIRRLREAQPTRQVPILIVSGSPSRLEADKGQADAVLSKPFDAQALLTLVGSFTAGA